jgi:hypothetical protein
MRLEGEKKKESKVIMITRGSAKISSSLLPFFSGREHGR